MRHSQANSNDSLPRHGRQMSSSPVDIVKRTLQTALSNAQSMFNPAYREFRFKDFSPGKIFILSCRDTSFCERNIVLGKLMYVIKFTCTLNARHL